MSIWLTIEPKYIMPKNVELQMIPETGQRLVLNISRLTYE